jgi:hypothetical protein
MKKSVKGQHKPSFKPSGRPPNRPLNIKCMGPLKNERIKGPLKRHKQFHEHVKYVRWPTFAYLYPATFEI